MKKITLLLALLLVLTACTSSTSTRATNLMAGISENDIAPIAIDNPQSSADKTMEITDFSLDILGKVHEGENTLISPLSIISALAMTANGAEKETLSQMEEVFGADIDGLNDYLYAYKSYLPTGDQYKVSLANSIWFKDQEGLTVEKEFLQTNKDYYDAEIYKAPLDERTKDDINAWVNEKTDGQINKLLEEKPPQEVIMYLINALSFDAEWLNIYEDTAVDEDAFTSRNGDKKRVDFMHSSEYGYIELPQAIGFSKPYADNQYSFVALLPEEGLGISDFIASMEGEILMEALQNQREEPVHASIPKFEFEYNKELSEILKELGIQDAFDGELANFSSLSKEGNLFISRVIHKTKINVDAKGTKAGAVTVVEMRETSMALTEPKRVHLNRPFFFIIMDKQFNLPIFMGVLNHVAG